MALHVAAGSSRCLIRGLTGPAPTLKKRCGAIEEPPPGEMKSYRQASRFRSARGSTAAGLQRPPPAICRRYWVA